MTDNNDSNVAKLVAISSAVDKPIIKEQSNSAAPTAQTVHNYHKEVYPGIMGNMQGGTFNYTGLTTCGGFSAYTPATSDGVLDNLKSQPIIIVPQQ